MEGLKREKYTVQVIPTITKAGEDENGKPKLKVDYERTTNPSAKTLAVRDENDRQVFGKQQTFWLEVYRKGEGRLDVDNRPFTVNIFQNTDRTLFEAIKEMVDDEKLHTIKDTARKPMVLSEPMPGLVRNRPAPAHYATRINSDGETVRLKANRRQPNGDFEPSEVILNNVTYFLFASEVNSETDEVRYQQELARIQPNLVTPMTREELAHATAGQDEEPSIEEGKEPGSKAA